MVQADRFLLIFTLFYSGYVYASDSFVADEKCDALPGVSAVVSNPQLRYIIFGEMHGTKEAPSFFAETVCALVTADTKILVGLEFPEEGYDAFQELFKSVGTKEDIDKFLVDSLWVNPASQYADGRTSQAMLDMVMRLRDLKSSGYEISVAPFQRSVSLEKMADSQTHYEKAMAQSILDIEAQGDYDLVLILVGNIHARNIEINSRIFLEPMAMHLPKDKILTLNMVSNGGAAWNCRGGECGEHALANNAPSEELGIVLDSELAKGYDGVFNIGIGSSSEPIKEIR